MASSKNVLIVTTADTKGKEAAFMKELLENQGIPVLVLDAGILGRPTIPTDIGRESIAAAGGKTLEEVQSIGHEGKALTAMIEGAVKTAEGLFNQGRIGGILGLGGSMGTTLGTAVMRRFPIGFPKVMVTTMASRDTRAFVGTKDILMLHAVCDLVGLNRITNKILHNGAMAMAGMVGNPPATDRTSAPMVFLSTLGTTEACAQDVRRRMESQGMEVVIFHTVGSGGRAMEEMIFAEKVTGVIELSLHEMADNRFGGDYDAGPTRGSAALQQGIPTVLVPGNIDFLVTGPLETAQKRFPGRPFHQHNAAITVVRSEEKELVILAEALASMCNSAEGTWKILVPMGGFSAFDADGGPLSDPGARSVFRDRLISTLAEPSRLQSLPFYINDPEFSKAVSAAFMDLKGK